MLRKYETGIQSRGMMNEVARSVLSSQELSTFTYYIEQYHQRGLSVEDLTTALLELLDTPEKVCLFMTTMHTMSSISALLSLFCLHTNTHTHTLPHTHSFSLSLTHSHMLSPSLSAYSSCNFWVKCVEFCELWILTVTMNLQSTMR